jgi:hypothetical protein
MTTATQCDGCEKLITGESEIIGHEVKHDYCETCAPVAKQMLSDVDGLHDSLAEQWEKTLSELKATYRNKLTKIPDEQSE